MRYIKRVNGTGYKFGDLSKAIKLANLVEDIIDELISEQESEATVEHTTKVL